MKRSKIWGVLAVLFITACIGIGFQQSDDRNFQISKNLDIFNALIKELDMLYVDTIDPNQAIRDGIDAMLAKAEGDALGVAERLLLIAKAVTVGK